MPNIIHEVNTEQPATREKFLRDRDIRITWELVGGDPHKGEVARFRFILKRTGRENESPLVWEEFNYAVGPGIYRDMEAKAIEPDVEGFLGGLRLDCGSVYNGETFDDFVDNLGLGPDAKLTVQMWEGVQAEWRALKRLLGPGDAMAFLDLAIEDAWT